MKKFIVSLFIGLLVFSMPNDLMAAKKKTEKEEKKEEGPMSSKTFAGLKFRNIGPAFMSGRIADIAIHPEDNNTMYVAVGSGGVWKTENAGTTWKPIFDKQTSYSIGCVTIDPNNPHTVWVGTGENVGGRHVGYGDGIYKSTDGGNTWKNLGLKESQHISKIIVHPSNSNIVWVAAQGPLWSKGGERGLFKTVDGGKNWKKVLGDEEWTGVTDIVIDSRNPDRMYAATWQKHRTVAAYFGGGPESGLHRSVDGGETWEKLKTGLPTSDIGKIGLAISPQNPDVVYAAIELDRRKGGLYRSSDRGSSWVKMSDAVSGATGPHYYQELYACPHEFDRLYLMDVRIQVSNDGGKTFNQLKEEHKHSDNHSLAFRMDDPDYLLVGTDGGIYETFDLANNWRFVNNLPLTQFYKLALDDSKPFYTIYGGTQDNNTQGGPSRTDTYSGIRNADWYVVLYADGHQPATEPGNPNIMYAEWQEGNLVRVDRATNEIVYIQPQPAEGENYERFNWDSPILVSPHVPSTIFYASQRVWKSEDRGDSWTAISGDLTRNQDRMSMPIMGKTQSWDGAWDMYAMSNYNTITSLAQSPKNANVIYAGTDDGAIQVTEDGGVNWRKVLVNSLPGVPSTAFVNDIKADLYNENTVYVALDNHKYGDFNPYLYKSTDKGKTWVSIKGNIPDRTLVWRLVQDHVKANLFFLATEFGIYFTVDGGSKWIKFTGNMPTISFRDLAIQKRENDLVGASFGRSFFVLDDYSALREISEQQLKQEASLFPVRDALWYIQRPILGYEEKGSQGASYYTAPNPDFGATFTYYIGKDYKTIGDLRKESEKKLKKEKQNIPFPGWDALEEERKQEKPILWFTIKDLDGNVINKISAPATKGVNRVSWDLTMASMNAIDVNRMRARSGDEGRGGFMVAPGKYTVTLSEQVDGKINNLTEAVEFNVVQLVKGSLKGSSPEETAAFWKKLAIVQKSTSAASVAFNDANKKVAAMEKALQRTGVELGELNEKVYALKRELMDLETMVYGNASKDEIGQKNNPSLFSRIGVAQTGTQNSTYGPTPTHEMSLDIAIKEFKVVKEKLEEIITIRIPKLETELIKAGAPWLNGQVIPDIE